MIKGKYDQIRVIVCTRGGGGGYYGLVVIPPRPQTFFCECDNLQNPKRIASIFYM